MRMAELKIMSVPHKIKMAEITEEERDIEQAKKSMFEVEKEMNEVEKEMNEVEKPEINSDNIISELSESKSSIIEDINSQIIKAEEMIKKNEKKSAIKIYNRIQYMYKVIPKEYKKEIHEKCQSLRDKLINNKK